METESCDIITVMDRGVMQLPVGTMETEGETHNSVPNYEIITITFLQIRTIRVFSRHVVVIRVISDINGSAHFFH